MRTQWEFQRLVFLKNLGWGWFRGNLGPQEAFAQIAILGGSANLLRTCTILAGMLTKEIPTKLFI